MKKQKMILKIVAFFLALTIGSNIVYGQIDNCCDSLLKIVSSKKTTTVVKKQYLKPIADKTSADINICIDNSPSDCKCESIQKEILCDKETKESPFNIGLIGNFLTFIAIVVSLIIFLIQEKRRKKERLKIYVTKNKYFKILITSFIPYAIRQINEIRVFSEKTKCNPLVMNRFKVEYNNDYERLFKLDSSELFESIYYYNRKNQFAINYRNVIYGSGIIYESVQRSKVIYEKYLVDINKWHLKLLDIINEAKSIVSTSNDVGLEKEFLEGFTANENEDNVNEIRRFKIINDAFRGKDNLNENQKKLYAISQHFISYYYILTDNAKSASAEFEVIAENVKKYIEIVEDKLNILELE